MMKGHEEVSHIVENFEDIVECTENAQYVSTFVQKRNTCAGTKWWNRSANGSWGSQRAKYCGGKVKRKNSAGMKERKYIESKSENLRKIINTQPMNPHEEDMNWAHKLNLTSYGKQNVIPMHMENAVRNSPSIFHPNKIQRNWNQKLQHNISKMKGRNLLAQCQAWRSKAKKLNPLWNWLVRGSLLEIICTEKLSSSAIPIPKWFADFKSFKICSATKTKWIKLRKDNGEVPVLWSALEETRRFYSEELMRIYMQADRQDVKIIAG